MGRNGMGLVVAGTMVFFFWGCGLVTRTRMAATSREVDVAELTSQIQFPGVESNLVSTQVYRAEISAAFPEGAQQFQLWTDSVALPARLIRDATGAVLNMAPGRALDVRLSANRNRYRSNVQSHHLIPEETYTLTGQMLEGGEVWLVFRDRWGNETRWSLGVPEILPPLYAP